MTDSPLLPSPQMMVLFKARFDAIEQGQQGALLELGQAMDDMHGCLKTIQDETKQLKALTLNQSDILTQLYKGESEVPRMFIVFKKDYKKTICGAIRKAATTVSTLGGTACEVSLYCEGCNRPVPKTFGITMPSEALVKMAPALLLTAKFLMVAASVAGGVSGVKLPLPSFASIDAIQATLKEVQALVGASLVNDVFECAESAFDAEAIAGMAAGQAAALSDDKVRSLAASSDCIQVATGDSYKSFKALLEKNVPNPENYGELLKLSHSAFVRSFVLFLTTPL
jgi:hypothetical protein